LRNAPAGLSAFPTQLRVDNRGVALALAGCVTAENSLSQNDIAGMKLTGVTVSYAPDAMVQWEDGIRAYARSKAITDDQIATATDTPEGKAYVRNMLAPRIKSGIEQKMAGQLNGSRPVRLEVVVKNFAIAGAVQRIRRRPRHGGGCQSGRCANRRAYHRLSGSDGFDTRSRRTCGSRDSGRDR
jgi:hypothetical protein